jgi:hypothetical protein
VENYFNYFTEIEEKFRQCRSEPVLLSPLDWALVESWKEQGFPLEAVLAGIERSFEKFKAGKRSYRKVNTLAYCSQEVFRAVEESRQMVAEGGTPRVAKAEAPAPFSGDEISRFLTRCAAAVQSAGQQAREGGKQVLAEELAEAAARPVSAGGGPGSDRKEPDGAGRKTERITSARHGAGNSDAVARGGGPRSHSLSPQDGDPGGGIAGAAVPQEPAARTLQNPPAEPVLPVVVDPAPGSQ